MMFPTNYKLEKNIKNKLANCFIKMHVVFDISKTTTKIKHKL